MSPLKWPTIYVTNKQMLSVSAGIITWKFPLLPINLKFEPSTMDSSRVLIFAAAMYLQTGGIFSASSIFLKEESINIETKPNFIYFSMSLVNKINELEKYNKLVIKL